MRSPEPNGGQRVPQNGMPQGPYPMPANPYDGAYLTPQVSQGYYGPAIPPHDYGAAHHQNPYYQPPVQVRSPVPQQAAKLPFQIDHKLTTDTRQANTPAMAQ